MPVLRRGLVAAVAFVAVTMPGMLDGAARQARAAVDGEVPVSGWYAAADGTPMGLGTRASPWDLATALAGGPAKSQVRPGDTVWVRGGTYHGRFDCSLTGNAAAPITVRACPGERVTLDKASAHDGPGGSEYGLRVSKGWVCFRDLEITNSDPNRSRTSPYTGTVRAWRGSGVDVYAPHVRFINLVLHDNGHGLGLWNEDGGTEVYGCLIYYNGNNKFGHGLYAHNQTGTMRIADNIIFGQGGWGIHGYGGADRHLNGIEIEGNAVFNNGSITLDDQVSGQILVGGVAGVPAERIVVRDNYLYNPPANVPNKNQGMLLGYADTSNRDVKLIDNYVVSRVPLRLWWWESVECTGNTIYTQGTSVDLRLPAGVAPASYRWNRNTYISGRTGGPVFGLGAGSPLDFVEWKRRTGLDPDSGAVEDASRRPAGVSVFVRPNKYEPGRAHVIVYNWAGEESVPVDVSSVLQPGALYEVRDAQDYYGEPLLRGTYDGKPLRLPMRSTRLASPAGNVERAPSHTSPEFQVFVLRQLPAAM